MYKTYSVLPYKLATNVLTFQSSSFKAKMVNHYEVHVAFQDIEHQLQEISFITLFIIVFHEILIKLRDIFDPLKVIY